MWKNIKWVRLTPDRPGRGGSKTGVHTFQQTPINDTQFVGGAHIYRGAWRRDFDSIAESSATGVEMGSTQPLALHGYVYPSLTDPAAQPGVAILSHQGFFGGGVNHVWDATNNVVRATRTTNSQQAGVFQNIGGRCFFGDGAAEGMIFDNRTPAIHAQQNQNIGISAPQQPLGQVTAQGAFVNFICDGTGYIHNLSPYINHPNPNSRLNTILNSDTVTASILDPNHPAIYNGGAPMAAALPTVNAVTSNTSTFTATGTISITTNTSLVTLSGAVWPANFKYAGLAINFNGYSFVVLTHGANGSAFNLDGTGVALSNTQLIIMGVYDGASLANVPYTITGTQVTMPANSTLETVNTNSAQPPPAGANGYSQSTNANIVQVRVAADVGGAGRRSLGNISFVTAGDITLASAHLGPTYAYAWYDPETGHCSDISPLFQIPKPTTFDAGGGRQAENAEFLTPCFQIDPGSISYPQQSTDGIRFSHILFFRTLSTPGSSTLYPIGSLNPFVGKVHPGAASTRGSWNPSTYKGWMGLPNNYVNAPPIAPNTGPVNYWFDFSSDSDLLLSGGFRAPQFTNSKPIALLRGGASQPGRPYALAYWDRRTWLTNTQEPDKILFSCDEAQCPLGIPTESFPPTNFLRLPSVDGRVIGMRTVGDMLLVTTQRWAYIIAGNNESNYRLLKVSASMPGVGTYQMDEFPTLTGAEGEPATLFYLGQDRIVYQWTIGGQAIPISLPIQKTLDTYLSQGVSSLVFYQGSRVHCVSAWGRRFVCVVPFAIAGTTFLLYDIDNQVWTSSYPTDGNGPFPNVSGIMPMTTVYGMGVPVNEIYSLYTKNSPPGVAVVYRSWVRDDVATSTIGMILNTFPLNFDGKKTRKQLVGVNIHATAGTYSLLIYPNESTLNGTGLIPFAAYPDPLDSIYGAPPLLPLDGAGSQDSVVLAAQFYGTSMPMIGYRFVLYITRTDTAPCTIYALDVAYVDMEEEGDGDA